MTDVLLVERRADVAILTLNRPHALNALSRELTGAIAGALERLAEDGEARVVVVRGAGERAFSVGADLKERQGQPLEWMREQRAATERMVRRFVEFDKPLIAAVHGWVLGGGFEIAMLCDIIVAADTAMFGLPETTLAIVPGAGGTQLLPRLVSRQRAKELIFTGRRFDALEAERLGLVVRRVPAGELADAALEMAERIAANGPIAVREAKRAIDAGVDGALAVGLTIEAHAAAVCLASEDRLEGLRAFAERRAPAYVGR